MPENYDQSEEIIVGNRRLRKIKRPKQHAAPIMTENTPNSYSAQPAQNTAYPSQKTEERFPRAPQEYPISEQVNPTSASLVERVSDTYDQTPSDRTYVTEDPYAYAQEPEPQNFTNSYLYGNIEKKKALGIALICLCVGAFIGSLLFGGSDQVVQNGLQGVVVNPEVPKGRARCGVAEKTQGCVLYIMNPQRQELNGRDFYDLASQQTGRQRFVIETGNMRYSSVRIRPGAIAQLNIPPLQ